MVNGPPTHSDAPVAPLDVRFCVVVDTNTELLRRSNAESQGSVGVRRADCGADS